MHRVIVEHFHAVKQLATGMLQEMNSEAQPWTATSSACLSLNIHRCRGTRRSAFPRRQATATCGSAMPLQVLMGALLGLSLPKTCLGLRSAENGLPGEGVAQLLPLRTNASGTVDAASGTARQFAARKMSSAEAAVAPTSALSTKAEETASAKVLSAELAGEFSNRSHGSADTNVGNFAGDLPLGGGSSPSVSLGQLAELHDGLSRTSESRSWQVNPSLWNFLGPLLAVLVLGSILALYYFCDLRTPPWATMTSVGTRIQGSRSLAADATGRSSLEALQERRSGSAGVPSPKKATTRVKFGFRESYNAGEPTHTGHKTSLQENEEQALPGAAATLTLPPSDASGTDSRRSRSSTVDSDVSEFWQDPTVGGSESGSDDSAKGKSTSSASSSMRRTIGSAKASPDMQRTATGW